MKNNLEQVVKVDDNQIAPLACQLWEQAGRPSGRDLEFWLAAEAKLRTIAKAAPAASAKAGSQATPPPDRRQAIPPAGTSNSQRNHKSTALTSAMN
jgi:hypothetical protein